MDVQIQAKLYAQPAPDTAVARCWGTTETRWITLFSSQEKDNSLLK
jgi:hypothetical protein